MYIRPVLPDDAASIVDIWNPLIKNTSITFTSAEKTIAGIQGLIADKATTNHGFYVADSDTGILGLPPTARFATALDMLTQWNTLLF